MAKQTRSSVPGIGVMLGMLGGNAESVAAIKDSLGKQIAALAMTDKAIRITFADGSVLRLADEGQSCCEHRYMRTDDKLDDFIGATLTDASLVDAPTQRNDDEYDVREVQFLRLTTDKGVLVLSNHNDHNGYYGGFWIQGSIERDETTCSVSDS